MRLKIAHGILTCDTGGGNAGGVRVRVNPKLVGRRREQVEEAQNSTRDLDLRYRRGGSGGRWMRLKIAHGILTCDTGGGVGLTP